jgi:hypothetical protein
MRPALKKLKVFRRRHMDEKSMIPDERIEGIIILIRGQKVILDRDLAQLYGVTTGNLNKAVKRNLERFPADFMFRLTREEYASLRFQFGSLESRSRAGDPACRIRSRPGPKHATPTVCPAGWQENGSFERRTPVGKNGYSASGIDRRKRF